MIASTRKLINFNLLAALLQTKWNNGILGTT
jgi:hypothetical protein